MNEYKTKIESSLEDALRDCFPLGVRHYLPDAKFDQMFDDYLRRKGLISDPVIEIPITLVRRKTLSNQYGFIVTYNIWAREQESEALKSVRKIDVVPLANNLINSRMIFAEVINIERDTPCGALGILIDAMDLVEVYFDGDMPRSGSFEELKGLADPIKISQKVASFMYNLK
ncbi:hypothetical protein HYT51_00785 [Candidatus Woesearchaeota archaeon]|nr:hypothetical protein [Candidatus Woesearchaeota archaeon]